MFSRVNPPPATPLQTFKLNIAEKLFKRLYLKTIRNKNKKESSEFLIFRLRKYD